MRTLGLYQLLLSVPLLLFNVVGYSSFFPLSTKGILFLAICVGAVAVTASFGMLLGSELCSYLAFLTNVVFLAGFAMLLCKILGDLAQPLPRQSSADNGPELVALSHQVGFCMSIVGLMAATSLLCRGAAGIRAHWANQASLRLELKPLSPPK